MHFSSDYWIFSLNEPIRTNDYRYESDMHAFIWSSLCFPRVLIFAQPMGKASSDNLGLSVFGYCIDVAILFRMPRTASFKHLPALAFRYEALPLEHSLKRQGLPLFDRFHSSRFVVWAVSQPLKGCGNGIVRSLNRFLPAESPYETARLRDVFALRPVIRPVAVPKTWPLSLRGKVIVVRRRNASRGCVPAC